MHKKWLWLAIGAMALCTSSSWAWVRYSDGWVPPRLVDGVWVTSGLSDEVAKQQAAICHAGKTKAEIQGLEWQAYWRWHWDKEGAPEWARQRGRRVFGKPWRSRQPSAWSTQLLGDNLTVYIAIAETGTKYHKAGCRYLEQSSVPIHLSDAILQEYTPCSRCIR